MDGWLSKFSKDSSFNQAKKLYVRKRQLKILNHQTQFLNLSGFTKQNFKDLEDTYFFMIQPGMVFFWRYFLSPRTQINYAGGL